MDTLLLGALIGTSNSTGIWLLVFVFVFVFVFEALFLFAPVLPGTSNSTGICLFVFVFVFEAHLICNCIAWNLKFNCILNQICLKILYKVCTGAIPPINNLAIQSNECRFNRILT